MLRWSAGVPTLPNTNSYIQLRCTVLVLDVIPKHVVALVVRVWLPDAEYLAMNPPTLLNRGRYVYQIVRDGPGFHSGIEHRAGGIDARAVTKFIGVLKIDTASFDVIPVPAAH